MTILYGAVAYREDSLNQFQEELNSWALAKNYPHPIACPKGGDCQAIYRLIVPIDEPFEQSQEHVSAILQAMERGECSKHPPRIRINPPHP